MNKHSDERLLLLRRALHAARRTLPRIACRAERLAVAVPLALAALPMSAAISADRSQLIQLLDLSFKCAPAKERLDARGVSSEVKYRYRFSADEAVIRIITHFLGVAHDVAEQERHHAVEQTQVATVRLSDLEVSRSWDSAFDKSVYISCTTDTPCIRNVVVLDRATLPRPGRDTTSEDEAQRAPPEPQFDSFAASYSLCDAQTAEYVRSGLGQLLALARAGRAH